MADLTKIAAAIMLALDACDRGKSGEAADQVRAILAANVKREEG